MGKIIGKNKIKGGSLALFLLSVGALSVTGCAPTEGKYELLRPTNLTAEEDVLSWEGDPNAMGYVVGIVGNVYNVQTGAYDHRKTIEIKGTECDLSTILSPEERYEISVKAVGDNKKFYDSEETTTSYQTKDVTQGLSYTLNDDGVSYSVGKGSAKAVGEIVIPDTYGGLPITKVGDGKNVSESFGVERLDQAERTTVPITAVRLPLGTTEIYAGAFMSTAIEKLVIPSEVKTIGGSAFYHSASLAELKLNEKLEEIGNGAFSYNLLQEIKIPDSVKRINANAFSDTKIEEITLSERIEYIHSSAFDKTPWWKSQPVGVVYLKNICFNYKTDPIQQNVAVKDGTYRIADLCFQNAQNVKKITLPESVLSVDKGSFTKSSIEEIVLPDSIKTIGDEAFKDCERLISVALPKSLTQIGRSAFMNCTSLKSVDFPSGLVELADSAFRGSGLKSVSLPNSVRKIGAYAFGYCADLTEVNIPEAEIEFGGSVFRETAVKSFRWRACYGDIPERAFQKCTALTTVTIEEGVSDVGFCAFSESAVTNVKLPKSLRTLGKMAFAYCENLQDITLPKAMVSVDKTTFYGITSTLDIYYEGDEEAFLQIENAEGLLSVANFHVYYSETDLTILEKYWHAINGELVVWTDKIYD